jgi:hypothetical protein
MSLECRKNSENNSRYHQNRIDNTIPTDMVHSEENNKTDDNQNAATNEHYPD